MPICNSVDLVFFSQVRFAPSSYFDQPLKSIFLKRFQSVALHRFVFGSRKVFLESPRFARLIFMWFLTDNKKIHTGPNIGTIHLP